jgi:DNA (cytosine-5)-methyltransferase 1
MNFASLFSGCGGFDLGFIEGGFSSIAAFDSDGVACENFAENIGSGIENCNLLDGIPNLAELKGIEVLIAGPPCQGFSTAGKRDLHDDRNHLLTHTSRLALAIQPKVLVVENVPGALAGKHSVYWHEMDAMMRGAGYRTHTLMCQTSDLGVAQMRKRVLFFAWKTSGSTSFDIPKSPINNLRSSIEGVKGLPNHKPRRLAKGSRDWNIASKINPGQKLSNVRGGENSIAAWDIPEVFGYVTNNEITILELLRRLRRQDRKREAGDADPVCYSRLEAALGKHFRRRVESLIEKGYLRRINGGVDLVGTFNGKYRRLKWDSPSYTVDTRFGSPRYFLHPKYNRGFTVREAARLQGFRDDYHFLGSERAQYRVIGNAVPPQLGKFAARMATNLLGQ